MGQYVVVISAFAGGRAEKGAASGVGQRRGRLRLRRRTSYHALLVIRRAVVLAERVEDAARGRHALGQVTERVNVNRVDSRGQALDRAVDARRRVFLSLGDEGRGRGREGAFGARCPRGPFWDGRALTCSKESSPRMPSPSRMQEHLAMVGDLSGPANRKEREGGGGHGRVGCGRWAGRVGGSGRRHCGAWAARAVAPRGARTRHVRAEEKAAIPRGAG